MQITRREMIGGVTLAGVATCTLTLEGCNVLGELETWVPVAISAFDGVISILSPFIGPAGAALQAIVNTASALWQAVVVAISNYEHSTLPVDTALAKVIAALTALQQGLDQILSALPVSLPAGVLAAIKAGLSLLISTLAYFQNKLQPTSTKVALKAAVNLPSPAPKVSDFVKQFNQAMSSNGQQFQLR
jgi:hypothetical protein